MGEASQHCSLSRLSAAIVTVLAVVWPEVDMVGWMWGRVRTDLELSRNTESWS